MKVYRKYVWVAGLAIAHLFFVQHYALAQKKGKKIPKDSVHLKEGDFLYRNDSFHLVEKDTVLFLEKGEYKVDNDDYKNTQKLYDSLAVMMDKSWITKEVYSMIFSSVARKSISSQRGEHVRAAAIFEGYAGMKIRNIYITKVDVLEGSVDDTLLIATSDISKFANNIHVNSKDWVILQYLLFKKGDYVNPYVLADNERIIRALDFIEDARIILKEISADEVNVYIITKDIFSLGVGGYFRGFDEYKFEVFDKNILGLGHELRAGIIFNNDHERPFGYGLQWNYYNIGGWLTDASLQYENTFAREYVRQIVSKRFLSPKIRYGGELDVGWKRDVLYDYEADTIFENPYELKYFDLWVGRSFLLNTEDKRTTLIIGGRYRQNNFLIRPEVRADTNMFFHDEDIFLGSISLKKINYFKSHKVHGFGIVEDIPYGFIARLTAGKTFSEFFERPYYGLQLSGGNYFNGLGYLWLDSRLGTFWKEKRLNELLWNFNVVYFSPLYDLGTYENRLIMKLSYNSGVNDQDNRGLNFYRRVRGVDDRALHGLGSYILGIESILFTPWYFYGFKMAPYAFADVGVISDAGFRFRDAHAYSGFGLGIRIRNESLAFSSISLRIAFVPEQPTGYSHIIFNGSAGRTVLFNEGFDDKPSLNMLDIN